MFEPQCPLYMNCNRVRCPGMCIFQGRGRKKMKMTARDKAVFAYGEACGKLKNQIGRAKREALRQFKKPYGNLSREEKKYIRSITYLTSYIKDYRQAQAECRTFTDRHCGNCLYQYDHYMYMCEFCSLSDYIGCNWEPKKNRNR